MNRIVVYSKAGCPFCSLLKMELDKRDIPYDEIDLSDDSLRADFYARIGASTVPQVFIADENHTISEPSGERLGGWSEVSRMWERLEM